MCLKRVRIFCGHICNFRKADHAVSGWIFWMNQRDISCINIKYVAHVNSTQTHYCQTSAQLVSGCDRCAFIMSGTMQCCNVPSPINRVRCLLFHTVRKVHIFFLWSFLPGLYKGQAENNHMVRSRSHFIQHCRWNEHTFTQWCVCTHSHKHTKIWWTWLSLLVWGSSTAAAQAFEHLATLQDFTKHVYFFAESTTLCFR